MKKEFFAAVLAGTMLLAGCAKAAPPTTVTTIGTSSPTVKPTETVPSTTAPSEPAPTVESIPTYDEFFAETVTRTVKYSIYNEVPRIASADIIAKNSLTGVTEGSVLLYDAVKDTYGDTLYAKPASTVTGSEDTAYIVPEDGASIVSVPLAGGPETNVYAAKGEILPGSLTYFEHCLFFAVDTGKNTVEIYRIYLPNGQADRLAEAKAPEGGTYRFGYLDVVSNKEVVWTYLLDIDGTYAAQCWNEPIIQVNENEFVSPAERTGMEAEAFLLDKSLDPNPVRNAIAAWVEKTGIPGQVYTYASPEATCTMTETLVADGYYPTYRGVYPDGTARPQAEFEKNEDRWWLDDYYTK